MKRALPLLLGALLLSACASSHSRGTSSIDYSPQVPKSSITPVALQREHAAERAAAKLLRSVPLPAGSVRLSGQPAGDANDLNQSGLGVSTVEMTADAHGYWQVPGTGDAVIAFEKRHLQDLHDTGVGSSPTSQFVEFDGPVTNGSPRRAVALTVVPLNDRTIVRIDAGVAWIYPRSPSEVLPAGVRQIGINDGKVWKRVTDPKQVADIVRWFDALNVYQPGPAVGCAAVIEARVIFVFRSASGARLASAVVPSTGPTSNCSAIQFTIGGKRQTPLIDNGRSVFISRVAWLLGVRFRVPTLPS